MTSVLMAPTTMHPAGTPVRAKAGCSDAVLLCIRENLGDDCVGFPVETARGECRAVALTESFALCRAGRALRPTLKSEFRPGHPGGQTR